MYNIIIVGAGGLGREVYTWINNNFEEKQENQFQIKGFLDINSDCLDDFDIEANVIGCEVSYEIQENDRFVLAIGDIDVKKKAVETLEKKGAQFISFIHHTAIVASTAIIGIGCIICPFVVVSDNVRIEDYVLINFHASCGHDVQIGKYSVLSPYATLNGCSILEEEVFLGTRATVVARKKIGFRSKVSANSVAMNDAPAHAFVFGVPGKQRVIFN